MEKKPIFPPWTGELKPHKDCGENREKPIRYGDCAITAGMAPLPEKK